MENDLALWIEWGWAYTSWAEAQWGQTLCEVNYIYLFIFDNDFGFRLFDAEDVCRPDIWGRMFDFKTFNAEDI